jgi:hypothetical protein
MHAENQTYTRQTIHLDGCSFYNCVFDRCRMIYAGLMSNTLNTCKLIDCTWSFEGPALNTVQYLSALYADGGDSAKLVEATFNDIRSGSHSRAPLSNIPAPPTGTSRH